MFRKIVVPRVIVVCCSDPKYPEYRNEFIHVDLRLKDGEFCPIVIPGASLSFAGHEQLENERVALEKYIERLTRNFGTIRDIIHTVHEDCAGLKDIDCFGKGLEESLLIKAVRVSRQKFPSLETTAYYARKKRRKWSNRKLIFENIAVPEGAIV